MWGNIGSGSGVFCLPCGIKELTNRTNWLMYIWAERLLYLITPLLKNIQSRGPLATEHT